MEHNLSTEKVMEALKEVQDPELKRSLVDLNMIRDLRVENGKVAFKVVLTTPACPMKDRIRGDCEAAVRQVPGVQEVDIDFGSEVRATKPQQGREPIPGVKNIICVASGKGGVGKSTVSVNLALALAKTEAKVGLLDADIYGPNVPMMLGIKDKQPQAVDGNQILPVEHNSLRVISIGMLVPAEKALIWRGPMLHSALQQFLRQVVWGKLDYLVVDLPPGTGDAQLTITQQVPLAGAVIVTTPQDVALADVNKAVNMFDEVNVPILGVVENMSGFVCPHCGEKTDIFGSEGGRRSAEARDVPFLGTIPIESSIREAGDRGEPIVLSRPESDTAKAFTQIAQSLAAKLAVQAVEQQGAVNSCRSCSGR